ncbi:MAG TPA: DUF5008 domain-containing protein [Parapedobacter sp.]|uniref:DUF5008 domain-containing protein n=1 Tax=Parapedobacter sp. TaxID=1958893 RepID=UPI002BDC4775|nr:DUF5008 domain-containing protein [Parapedobacter sp.]HWK56442.1 DUF5008 domain-containing protein [Parapedobacter sp.]
MQSIIKTIVVLATLGCCCWSCSKEMIPEEPYGPGKEPLGITVNRNQAPTPASGLPGTEVTIKASGLLPFREELVFRFNGEIAEITEVTETEIKLIVPDFASTGVTTVSIGDVVVFGPNFSVTGKINVDPTFNAARGTDGSVEQVIWTEDGRMLLVGNFTDYDNKGVIRRINRIARTFSDGTYDASLRSGLGANGALNDIVPFNNGYLIGGAFSGYSQRSTDISNLTKLNGNGTIDTMGIRPFRRPDQSDTIKYYPSFNGGFDGHVGRVYPQGNKVVVGGGFRYYISRQYDKPNRLETRDSVIMDSVEVRHLARLHADGTLDSTFRFDEAADRFRPGGNGDVYTIVHDGGTHNGKFMVYGSFNQFDGVPAGRILRLNTDGSVDGTFNPGGSGADQSIAKLFYNATTRKYIIAGNFRQYNGKPANRVAVLNEDGTLDESFVAKTFDGSGPNFAKQLSDGKIIVSGDFRTYNGVARNGFMVLDESGNLIPGYNATGIFDGTIENIVETTGQDGRRALLIYGEFSQFNSKDAYNYIRVIIE